MVFVGPAAALAARALRADTRTSYLSCAMSGARARPHLGKAEDTPAEHCGAFDSACASRIGPLAAEGRFGSSLRWPIGVMTASAPPPPSPPRRSGSREVCAIAV